MLEIENKQSDVSNVSNEPARQRSLDSPGVAAEISRRIHFEINEWAIETYYEAHRWHLGASVIGHECSAYLWFMWRWCAREVGRVTKRDDSEHANLGRSQRLLNRGHREEDRFVEYLRGIGAEVWTHDNNGNQYRMAAINGHFGGSLDAVVKLPIRYGIPDPLLGEFKTNGTGKGFNDLKEKGLAVAKMQHFIQQSCYGREYGFKFSIYFNVNKNDDDLHVEVAKLNWPMAEQMKAKAERIIWSVDRPPRLAENPTFHKCAYCCAKPVCHEGALPERNCRSCANASPSRYAEHPGQWICALNNQIIPKDFAPIGCSQYKPIINGA
jgi:hypothetical protein